MYVPYSLLGTTLAISSASQWMRVTVLPVLGIVNSYRLPDVAMMFCACMDMYISVVL
jgi:hypothetical protein